MDFHDCLKLQKDIISFNSFPSVDCNPLCPFSIRHLVISSHFFRRIVHRLPFGEDASLRPLRKSKGKRRKGGEKRREDRVAPDADDRQNREQHNARRREGGGGNLATLQKKGQMTAHAEERKQRAPQYSKKGGNLCNPQKGKNIKHPKQPSGQHSETPSTRCFTGFS